MYLVYEKNYGFDDVNDVEKSKFALFHNKENALNDMRRRKKVLLEENPSFSFMEEKSDETSCIVIADCLFYDPDDKFTDPEIHICLAEVSESNLKGKDMVILLRRIVEWILQDSSELSEAKQKLEEMGFSKEECEALGFPEILEEDTNDDGKMPNLPKNSKFDICRMLTISLDHASYELQMDMQNNGLTNKLGGVTVYRYEYGYEIHTKPCDTEEEWESWLAGIDPRLHRMLRIAREQQCSILRLDEDGPVMDNLPVFTGN